MPALFSIQTCKYLSHLFFFCSKLTKFYPFESHSGLSGDPSKKYVYLEHESVALFGKSIFEDVIKDLKD